MAEEAKTNDTPVDDTDVEEVETSLEDDDLSFDDWDESDEEVESEEDDTESESNEDELADESEEESEEDVEVQDEPTDSEDDTTSQPEQSSEEKSKESNPDDMTKEEQKRYNDEMARRRIAEKQLREEREQREERDLRTYLEAAKDDDTELSKRQIEVQAYQLQKQQAQFNEQRLQTDLERAVSDIGLKDKPVEVQEELINSVEDFERMYVKRDKRGNVVGVESDVYQYLKNKADSIERLTGIGARQQQKNKANEKSRAVSKPVRTPKPKQADPLLDAFDEEADKWD